MTTDRQADVSVVLDGGWVAGLEGAPGLDAGGDFGALLAALLARHRHGRVRWWDARLAPLLSPPREWRVGAREIRHLGFTLTPPAVLRRLQSAAGEDPMVVPPPVPRRRLTWLLSAGAGIAGIEALAAAGGLDDGDGETLAARLAACGWRAAEAGIATWHHPALLRDQAAQPAVDRWTAGDVARLIDRRWGRLRRWPIRLERLRPAARGPLSVPRQRLPPALEEPPPGTPRPPSVDAVIPTLDRTPYVLDLLGDLAAQTLPPARVVVVEQRPGDAAQPLAATLAGRAFPFQLIHRTSDRLGASRARNLALADTAAAWLALLDDDVRLPPGFLHELVAEAERHGATALSARELAAGEPLPATAAPAAATPHPCAGLGSGRALVERRALLAVGGFDQRIEGWGEDVELGLRLHHAGGAVMQSRRVHLVHLKAPRGGFRAPRPAGEPLPGWLAPKPSPLIVYRWLAWMPPAMLRGAVTAYLLRALRGHRAFPLSLALAPLVYLRFVRARRRARALLALGPELLAPAGDSHHGAEARERP